MIEKIMENSVGSSRFKKNVNKDTLSNDPEISKYVNAQIKAVEIEVNEQILINKK